MAQPIKVFVGSLPPGTKPEELRRLFENYGNVVECDVMNRCGFVHMKNAAMAESAIEALHESEFKGQNIVVEYGRPKERKQGGGGNQGGGPRRGGGGGGNRGIMVGFPGKSSDKFNQAATLQLAGVIMDLLGDQQNQLDAISGGNEMRGGGGDAGFRRGGGGRSGNFQSNRPIGNQNMNGGGPMRNQGFNKGERSAPYSQQGMNMGGGHNYQGGGGGGRGARGGGGRFNNQPNRGGGPGGPPGNFNNHRGGNFAPKPAGNNYSSGSNWNNSQRGGIPQPSATNFAEDNFSSGFSGNMGNSGGGSFGGQQDRRGFALPSNQFQQYGAASSSQLNSFASNDCAPYTDDAVFQRRNNNPPNAPIIIDFRSGQGGGNMGGTSGGGGGGSGNYNRGGNPGGRGGGAGNQGGFHNNRVGQGFQQGGGFKRGGGGGNNMLSDGNYQQNFPLIGENGIGSQGGGFGGNNRNHGGPGGRGGGGGGAGMNRNAPRQNMPNRRY